MFRPVRRFVSSLAAVAFLAGAAAAVPAAATPAAPSPRAAETEIVPLCDTETTVGYARCFAEAFRPAGARRNTTSPDGLTPADLRDAYKLPAAGGAGTTVAIVDAYDDPTAAHDLAVYRKTFGLPALRTGQLRIIDQRGGYDLPAPDDGWAGEISLDLDAVSAVAPLADIVLVEADSPSSDDLGAAVAQAVAEGADVVSNSYGSRYASGAGENPGQLALDAQYYDHPGVAVVASTGDDGYGVAFPAASPHVTAVGGTTLRVATGTARGWKETVWSGAGSGCSAVEPKPAWQTGTSCDHRAVADVAAVADPRTGLASYNTWSGGGWGTVGGTSLAAPVVAGVYALAGRPVAGTEPVTYPWAHRSGLFDVTGGSSNGTCAPTVWCRATKGWDGPTGLGTPNGTGAFTTGPHGTVAGVVTTTKADHAPVPDATVTATRTDGAADPTDRATAVSDADGHYSLTLSSGTWQVSAVSYGSYPTTTAPVTVRPDVTTTLDVGLRNRIVRTISGTVTDASGHGWPLAATVTVDGLPGAPVHTYAATGQFRVPVSDGRTYTLHVASTLPGYTPVTRRVRVDDANVATSFGLTVDPLGVAAPGYETRFTGPTQHFDGSSAPNGWTVSDTGDTPGWRFDDPGARGNLTGGSGGFAIADSDHAGAGHQQDSLLTGPASDLRSATHPVLEFDTIVQPYDGQTTEAQLSTDGGTTWTTVWTPPDLHSTTLGHVSVPVPTAAGKRAVRVRFHYAGAWAQYWQVDDVALGDRAQVEVPGGLVLGLAVDATTGTGLGGAALRGPGEVAVITGSSGVGGAWAETFAPSGTSTWTATHRAYRNTRVPVRVVADRVNRATFALTSGQTSAPADVTAEVAAGHTTTALVTVTNTGTAAVTVTPSEQAAGYDVPSAATAAVDVPATVSRAPATATRATGRATPAAVPRTTHGAWRSLAAPPTPIQDSATATGGGAVWSVGGFDGTAVTAALYRLDLRTGTWSRRADAGIARQQASAGFIGGKLYVTGGWADGGSPSDRTEVYDPATDTWSTLAPLPIAYAAMGEGVVGNKLYVVGGCTRSSCGAWDLQVYDPTTDTWSWAPGMQDPVSYAACGGISGALYCAGGTTDADTPDTATWRFDPAAAVWTRVADLPTDQWGAAVAVGAGQLIVSGGVVGNVAVTNRTWAYDPRRDRWTALPPAPVASYRGGAASGLFTIGGATGDGAPLRTTSVLPGWGAGAVADAPWLSVPGTPLTLAPHQSAQVTLQFTAGALTPPSGTYDAAVVLDDDSPYPATVVRVHLRVR